MACGANAIKKSKGEKEDRKGRLSQLQVRGSGKAPLIRDEINRLYTKIIKCIILYTKRIKLWYIHTWKYNSAINSVFTEKMSITHNPMKKDSHYTQKIGNYVR